MGILVQSSSQRAGLRKGTGVGGNDAHFAVEQAAPEAFLVFWLLHLGTAGKQMSVRLGKNGVFEHQVLYTGLGIDVDARF